MIRRILLSADAVGGVWTWAVELARGLKRHGVEVILATMGPEPSRSQREQLPDNVRLHASAYRLEWMDDPWTDVGLSGNWLLDLEAKHAPEVVVLSGYAHGAFPFVAPTMIVAHSCVCSWFEAVKRAPAPPEWGTYRFRVARGLRGVQHVVAVSRAMLGAIHRNYGSLTSSSVIHDGRDVAARALHKEPYVLGVGRVWDQAKNLDALERIAERLSWPVFLAGDAPEPSRHRLGRLDESALSTFMGRASIAALPARYEPFGLSALEAAQHGCALVLGDIPSQREIWGDAAEYVSPFDDDALLSKLEALIADPMRRADLGERARTRARRYGRAAMTDAYRALFEELVRGDVPCAS